MLRKVKCYKCGSIQETEGIYGYTCKNKQGGCGKLINVTKAKVIKDEN